jgi:hydroxymethylbilane synthase
VHLRGNVNSRITKLETGQVDAILLAMAGMKRLNILDARMKPLPASLFVPAVAQGAIGVECREEDEAVLTLLAPLHHAPTAVCLAAERALLARLDGSCRTPIAAHAVLDESGTRLTLNGMLATTDAARCMYHTETGSAADAVLLGQRTADILRRGMNA